MSELVLAGDIGGTKAWLGMFACDGARPTALATRRFTTLKYDGLAPIIAHFLEQTAPRGQIVAACLGVAGPVRDNTSRLTNLPWRIDAAALAERFGIPAIRLLNDLEALAYAVPWLAPHELAVSQAGAQLAGGTMSVIAPGTGLGEACLHTIGHRRVAMPSEAGHADFAARTPRELELVAWATTFQDRVALEDIVSGPGLVTLHRFTHLGTRCLCGPLPACPTDQPAAVTTSALTGACGACGEALDLFVAALGAAAGNLALRSLSTGGLYVGGGIAPRILPALRSRAFLDAFTGKGPMRTLVEQIPVSVILEPHAALIGAAVQARAIVRSRA